MRWQFIFVVFISLLVYSCETNLTDIGSTIQPSDDAITIAIDSFNVSSSNFEVPYIYSKPDSFLLGTFVDDTYGTLYADILTQLQPPVDISYPENAVSDSAKLFMHYSSWFGDKYSPIEVSVYKMDKQTFSETQLYKSDINPSDYSSLSDKLGSKIFTARDYGYARPDSNSIEIKMNSKLVSDFNDELKKKYTKYEESLFHTNFNGIYINTKFGTASMLNIRYIYLRYFYHYTYTRKAVNGVTDSVVTVKTYQDYPASEEIRTVNRLQLPNRTSVLQKFNANTDINVISSPSNIYTNVTVPLNVIKNKLESKVNGKTLLLNRAKFRINVTNVKDTSLAIPLVSSILMIYEDSVDTYFKKRTLPSQTISVIGNIAYEYDKNNNVVYYYSFDLSKILTYELKKKDSAPQELKFRLVPVSISYDGSKNIKEIKQQNLMRAVQLCSGSNPDKPMRLDMVYSGF